MAKCRENRAKRLKNRRKIRRLAIQQLAEKLPLRSGHRPYYEAYDVRVRGREIRWKERTTRKYRELIKGLAAMCGDVIVTIPAPPSKEPHA